jgi:hypothetical protein
MNLSFLKLIIVSSFNSARTARKRPRPAIRAYEEYCRRQQLSVANANANSQLTIGNIGIRRSPCANTAAPLTEAAAHTVFGD